MIKKSLIKTFVRCRKSIRPIQFIFYCWVLLLLLLRSNYLLLSYKFLKRPPHDTKIHPIEKDWTKLPNQQTWQTNFFKIYLLKITEPQMPKRGTIEVKIKDRKPLLVLVLPEIWQNGVGCKSLKFRKHSLVFQAWKPPQFFLEPAGMLLFVGRVLNLLVITLPIIYLHRIINFFHKFNFEGLSLCSCSLTGLCIDTVSSFPGFHCGRSQLFSKLILSLS